MGSRVALLDIVELISKLRGRIEKYRDLFRNNEALTRYALIDPLLRALGWDTEDPEQVVPEFTTEAGRPDYALKINGKTVVFIEAKALGTQWDDKLITKQVLPYANASGVPYAVVTDGDRWEVYEVFKPAELRDRIVASWQITRDSPQEIALRALSIANLGSMEAVGKPGYRPILLPEEIGEAKSTAGESRIIEGPITSKLARKLILQILAEVDKPMGRKDILNEVEKRVKLTEHDTEKLESGISRWEATVNSVISGLYEKGLITRVGENSYVITDKGREELNKL